MPVGPDDGLTLPPIIKGIGGPSVDVLYRPSTVDSAVKSTIDVFFSLSPFEVVIVFTSYFIDVPVVKESRF